MTDSVERLAEVKSDYVGMIRQQVGNCLENGNYSSSGGPGGSMQTGH